MQICFFEDQFLTRLHPLTLTRPVDDLRVGPLTIREKWELELSSQGSARMLRPYLEEVFEQGKINAQDPCIWINGRYLPYPELLEKIRELDEGCCLNNGASVIAAKVNGELSSRWLSENKTDFNSLLVVEANYRPSIEYLWDLFLMNGKEIARDIERMKPDAGAEKSISSRAVLENRDQIHIAGGARIEPGAILIADEGPIYIGRQATVSAGAILRGPVAICDHSIVKMNARIYDGVTIGPVCKAAGEINNSIFHSYSNKAHEGFVGNSLIGQWCNFGADTNTSNLKNNYSKIQMTNWETREMIDTGQQFIGTIMGDHSKTAINVQLNTGTICGVSCNIFTSDFPPKFIPSFSWVGTNVIQPYKFDKAAETMEAVMKRRDVEMTPAYKKMMSKLAENSRV